MMRRAISLCFLIVAVLLSSCKKEVDPAEVVGKVAKQYYGYLLDGKYDEFVDSYYRPDSIPVSYREQLVANAKMFIGQQQADHKGMIKIDILRADVDTARHTANAYLSVVYGDSICEEILVPMVEKENVWYLR